MNQTIGKRILMIIEENNLSQREFAKDIGYTTAAVNNWVNDRSDISIKKAIAICEKFNISADWLLMGAGEMHW